MSDLSDEPPPNITAPAGWYPDPSSSGDPKARRYWDGYRWTDKTSEVKVSKWGDKFVLWSILAALLMPIIGWVLALILLVRGRGSDAFAVFLVSIVGWFVALAVFGNLSAF